MRPLPLPVVDTSMPADGLPDSASKHFVDHTGKLDIRTETGGEVGYCLFDNGSECEEWAFLHAECSPGAELSECPAWPPSTA
jgi:putative hemolysin